MSILSIIQIVLSLLNSFVQWGQRTKVFKEDESIIALTLLANAQKDIDSAKKIKDDLNSKFDADPSIVSNPDEFTRDKPN